FDIAPDLVIEILSDKINRVAGEPERGVALRSVVLHRQTPVDSNDPASPEFVSPGSAVATPWYMNDQKLFDDVLKSIDTLEHLYITGGEPLINRRVTEMIDFLMRSGASRHIDLELSTNCTRVDARMLDRFQRFRRVNVLLSLDGVGDVFEYI